jgi:hypothetical protein
MNAFLLLFRQKLDSFFDVRNWFEFRAQTFSTDRDQDKLESEEE